MSFLHSLHVAFFLAVRSIARTRRILLVLVTVMMALVYLNLVFTPSLLAGLISGTNSRLIHTLSSNIVAEPNAGKAVIPHASETAQGFKKVRGVTDVTTRSVVPARIQSGNDFGFWPIEAIHPEQDKRMFQTSQAMVEGTYLEPDDTDQIVLGLQVAGADRKDLELFSDSLEQVHAGSRVKVTYAGGLEKEYTVKGIFYTRFIQADLKAYITNREYESLKFAPADTATSIHVKTAGIGDEGTIAEEMSFLPGNLKLTTWQDKAGVIKSMTGSFTLINDILRVIAIFVAAIVIFILTYVDVTTKRRQIGIQRAIGISQRTILMAYIFRAFIYAALGTTLAIPLFIYVIVPYQVAHPFPFPTGDVVLQLSYASLLANVAILWSAAIFSAILPASRALKVRITDAIWGN